MKHKRLTVILTAMVALSVALTGCNAGGGNENTDGPGEVNRDATLRAAVKRVPANLDPAQAPTYAAAAPYLDPIYDRLLRFSADGMIEPMLATSWEFVDNGGALRLELRDDVTFSDGSPFNAEVAKANLERYASDAATRAVSVSLSSMESVEVIDEYTIELNTVPGTGADLPSMLADTAGYMISGEALDNPDLDQKPVGSGPYALAEFVPGVSTVVERRDEAYWGGEGEANFARIEVEAVVDQRTMLDAVVSGRFDIVLADQDARTTQIEDQGRLNILTAESGYIAVMFNKNRVPEFENPLVRQAFGHAVDRQAIGNITLEGACRPTAQMVSLGAEGYLPELDDAQNYDPDKARDLLAEAGITSMNLNALFTASSPTREVAEALQAMLADVGITLDFETTTTGTQTTDWLEGKADLRVSTGSAMADQGRLLLRSTDDPILLGLSAPEVAEASVGIIDASLDAADRVKVIEATNRAMVEQTFNLVLCQRGLATVYVPALSGVEDIGSSVRGGLDFRSLALAK